MTRADRVAAILKTRTWYIEARVGSNNYGGKLVHFIDDRRGVKPPAVRPNTYDNRWAEEVMAELLAENEELRAALASPEGTPTGEPCPHLRVGTREGKP